MSTLVIFSFLSFALFLGFSVAIHLQPAAADLGISAVGDWGCSSNTQQTVNNIKNKNPQLVLALGDYSYQSTAKCWLDKVKPIDSKTKINIGNHEVGTKKLLDSYLDHFKLSKQYYSFDFHQVHVLTMSTETSFKSNSAQFKFVNSDLQKASKNSSIKWIIVNMHKPLYSSPNTCSASSCKGVKSLRDTYHSIFDKYGVDLVLEGHVHDYQRSFPVKYNPSNPPKPVVTSSKKNDYVNPTGEIYALVGTGGINLHGLSGKSSFISSQQDSKFGVLDIKITNGGSKLVAKYYTNSGSIKDQFSITKLNSGSNSNPFASGTSSLDNPFSPS
ncbi:MAG: metallophosphoesterase [Nitrososphaerales archaeon]